MDLYKNWPLYKPRLNAHDGRITHVLDSKGYTMRLNLSPVFIGGTAICGGIVALALSNRSDLEGDGYLLVLVGVVVLVAAMLARCVTARLAKVNRPADAAFQEGYEMGYDRGWLEGHRKARPVVVGLDRGRETTSIGAKIANT